jgi:hypothetical protein
MPIGEPRKHTIISTKHGRNSYDNVEQKKVMFTTTQLQLIS